LLRAADKIKVLWARASLFVYIMLYTMRINHHSLVLMMPDFTSRLKYIILLDMHV